LEHAETATASSPTLADVASAAGFKTVYAVRLVQRGGRTRAEATGILHRYPQTVPVSLLTAGRLVAAGAPLDVARPPLQPVPAR
jgi:hypothetical protein